MSGTEDVAIVAHGEDADAAYANALRIADASYQIFSSVSIRKVRGQLAWRVVFAVYGRHDGRPIDDPYGLRELRD